MKLFRNIVLVIGLGVLLSGCAHEAVESVDSNGDGKPDVWIHKRNNTIVMTEIDRNYNGKINKWYYWGNDGELIKDAILMNSKKDTAYYRNSTRVLLDGKPAWKNELDFDKTYQDKDIHKLMSKIYLYTRNNELLVSESDKNQDGTIDETVVIKNFRKVDEYRGPYKGNRTKPDETG